MVNIKSMFELYKININILPKNVNSTNFIADFFASFSLEPQSPPIKKYAGINSNSQNKKNTNMSLAEKIPSIEDINNKSIE